MLQPQREAKPFTRANYCTYDTVYYLHIATIIFSHMIFRRNFNGKDIMPVGIYIQ